MAPEKIENVYARAPSIAQIFVYGNSLEASLVGVAVPDMEVMPQWLSQHVPSLPSDATMQEVCANAEVERAVMKELDALAKAAGLHSFECIKALHLHPELFSVENNLLTPTFKAKRPQLLERFQHVVQRLYAEIHARQSLRHE